MFSNCFRYNDFFQQTPCILHTINKIQRFHQLFLASLLKKPSVVKPKAFESFKTALYL